jgi:CheY-like chemotaxis protein
MAMECSCRIIDPGGQPVNKAKKILVIDDEKIICETLHDYLEDEGYTTLTAYDGVEGLEIVRREKDIDLIVTDIMMPKKEGISTIRTVRQEFPHIKIIAMSGAANYSNYLETAQFFGVEHVLSKPVNMADLCKIIKNLIEEDKV